MSTQATETEAIKRSVTVDCSVEHAFETFTERIADWWPLGKHSIEQYESGNPAETVVFQGGAGARRRVGAREPYRGEAQCIGLACDPFFQRKRHDTSTRQSPAVQKSRSA